MTRAEPIPEDPVAGLTRQLAEARDTLRALRNGEVDAVVVETPEGNSVYTLQTADHPYRILVEQMNEGALMLSREGFVLHANPHFAALVKSAPFELNAASIFSWIAPEDQDKLQDALCQAFGGSPQRLELTLLEDRSASVRLPVVLSLGALRLTSVDAVCGVVTDLRERHQKEHLERAELMARSLMDHATAAVIITDRDGRIVHSNAAAEKLAGRRLGSEPFELAFPLAIEIPEEIQNGASLSTQRELAKRATAGTCYRGIQARMENARGEIADLQVSAGPFAPAENEIAGAVFTLSDVTALRSSEQRFRALAESIPQIVWSVDKSTRLTYINSVGIEYFGASIEELAANRHKFIHPEDIERADEFWQTALRTGEPVHAEYRLLDRRGAARWFLTRAVPVRDATGQVNQWFGTSTDMDTQKRTENDLRSANTDLEHFAYAASHDFQEPLRMVTAYAQLLQEELCGQLPPPAAMSLKYVLEGTERLGALLQNLLAYMRANRSYAGAEEINCDEVLQEVIASLRMPIEQSGAVIRCSSLPAIVCPRIHMLELLQNLINNAIKYRSSERPEIEISAEDHETEWIFSVRDNGLGIAPEHQKTIFGVFRRLHGNNIPGTGIGLAICRRLVEQHGGRIWVDSEAGQGSVFHFSLPKLPRQADMPATRPVDVVLVEDNSADVFLIRRALREAGLNFNLQILKDGEEALQFVKQVKEPAPDLFVMDWNLPRVHGKELLKAMSGLDVIKHTPRVVLTSSESTADRLAVEQLGGIFLTKPRTLEGFMQVGHKIKSILAA